MEFDHENEPVLAVPGLDPAAIQIFAGAAEAGAVPRLIVPVILSGGGGSRLWPVSTIDAPKQFLPLIGHRSLFQEALGRFSAPDRFSAPIVVANARHAELSERELRLDDPACRLILEPCGRNTAAAIVMAATVVQQLHGRDALMLIMPS